MELGVLALESVFLILQNTLRWLRPVPPPLGQGQGSQNGNKCFKGSPYSQIKGKTTFPLLSEPITD